MSNTSLLLFSSLQPHYNPTLPHAPPFTMAKPRFLLVTFPAQGHINPSLQFAKRLAAIGAEVTFVTSLSAYRHMSKGSTPAGLSFSPFSDGYDEGFKPGDDFDSFKSEMHRRGSQALSDLIVSAANEGRPFTCLVYTLLLSWPPLVAHELHVPSAMLWIQPATVFDIYYYYFHGYGDTITEKITNNPSCSIELPGLPLQLTGRDLPSFIDASNTYSFAIPIFKEQFGFLDKESNPKVLVNTFDALEPEALRAIGKVNMIAIGPLTPSAFLGGKDPTDNSFGCDLFKRSKDYNGWLNSRPRGSVIYVSFGSLCVLSKQQTEEIGRALLDSGRPFLWVIREKVKKDDEDDEEEDASFREELEKLGMIVPWCSQLDVLSNTSLGCFVTHCGWNSTLESLGSGVPVVAFPQWTDQGTNAKLIEDVWKTGMRVKANREGIVERDEIKKCLETVMGGGEKGEEIRRNAKRWKDLAREAAKEGGSSETNLKDFVNEIANPKKAVSLY